MCTFYWEASIRALITMVGRALSLLAVILCISGCHGQTALGTTDCGDASYYTEDGGILVSHVGFYHGHNYGKDLYCVWHIEAPEGMLVQLNALDFTLESEQSCEFDSLDLHDGNMTTSLSIGKFCGTTFRPVTSTGRFLTLVFATDGSDQNPGFRFFYNFTSDIIPVVCDSSYFVCGNNRCVPSSYLCDEEDDCGDDTDEMNCSGTIPSTASTAGGCRADTQFTCVGSGSCILLSWECDGDSDCDDGSDEHCPITTRAPEDTCGGPTYTNATTGRIITTNYPNDEYPSNALCLYYINVTGPAQGITLTFSADFDVETHARCIFDYVIIKGAVTDSGPQEFGPYCGDTSPGEVIIIGTYAMVTFKSDSSNQFGGYALDWAAIP